MKERFAGETWAPAWNDIAEQWLGLLAERMGPEFRLRRSSRFFTLDAYPDKMGTSLITFANATLNTLETIFSPLGRPATAGQRVIIFFATRRDYYSYVSCYVPDGASEATSGGMYLRRPYSYRHTICPPKNEHELRHTVAHELTHHVLDHLRLPLWLEEGLAKMMEERITGFGYFRLDREMVRRHRDYWTNNGLSDFWLGRSYRDPEGQELSYNLSQVFTRRIASDWPKRIMAFVRDATYKDGGDASARQHLGVSLQKLAESFLGPGDWEFRPPEFKPPAGESQ
jgi:hypothetical protein